MKTNNLIYLLVIVLLSSIHCDVNAQYYWSQNRKIALTPDSSHLVLNIEADLIRTPMLSSDYKGFNENRGKNYILNGYWKVYGNEEEARKSFFKYRKCTDVYHKLFMGGTPIEKLVRAAAY